MSNPQPQKITPIYNKIIEWILIAIVITVPIVFGFEMNSLGLTKLLALRFLSLIVLGVWVIKLLSAKKMDFYHTYLDWPILAFLVVSILATCFSVNITISFFGYYDRYEGLLTTINYIFLFYVVICLCRSQSERGDIVVTRLMNGAIITGGAVASYGMMQHFGMDFIQWENSTPMRVFATFGNPIHLGAYLTMIFPLILTMIFIKDDLFPQKSHFIDKSTHPLAPTKKKKHGQQPKNIPAKKRFTPMGIIYGVILCICFFAFCNAQSRGAFIGLIGALVVFFAIVGIKPIIEKRKLFMGIGAGLFIITIYFNINPQTSLLLRIYQTIFPSSPIEITPPVTDSISQMPQSKTNVSPQELANSVDHTPSSTKELSRIAKMLGGRYYIWESTGKIVKDHPLIGVGPDALGLIDLQYRAIESIRGEGAYATAATAHNEILDVTVMRGLLGLGSWVWLLIAFLIFGIKAYRQSMGEQKFLYAGILSSWVANVIQNQTGFGTVPTSSLWWMLMGMIVILRHPGSGVRGQVASLTKTRGIPTSIPYITFIIVGISIIFLMIISVFRPWRADVCYEQSTIYAQADSPQSTVIGLLQKACRLNPYETQYHRELAVAYIEYAKEVSDNKSWLEKAIEEAKVLIKLNPYDSIGHVVHGAAYYMMGNHIEKAISAYQSAFKYDPYNPDLHNLLGLAYQEKGKYKEAIAEYKKALFVLPESMALINLDALYRNQNRWEEAIYTYKQLLQYAPNSVNIHNYLATAYEYNGMLPQAIDEFKHVLLISPNNQYARSKLKEDQTVNLPTMEITK